jgi:hypothetical protein
VLRRIFGSNREEVVGDLRRLHNEELHNLYTFYYSDQIKDEMDEVCGMHGLKNLKGRNHSEDLDVDGKIMLE